MLVIVGVLATIAIPSFTSLSQSQRVKNASMDFYSLLTIARSEAIKRNADVNVTLSTDRIDVTLAGGTLLYSKFAPKKVVITSAVSVITYKRTGRTTSGSPTFQIDIEEATAGSPSDYVRCVTIGLSGMPNARLGAC